MIASDGALTAMSGKAIFSLIGGFASSLLACGGARDILRAGPLVVTGKAGSPLCCFAAYGFYDSLLSGKSC